MDRAVDAPVDPVQNRRSPLCTRLWTDLWAGRGQVSVHSGPPWPGVLLSLWIDERPAFPSGYGASMLDDVGQDDAAHTTPDLAPTVEVRRSSRRRRTVSAYQDGDRIVVMIPAAFSVREEREWVGRMVARLQGRRAGRRSDAELTARAERLSHRYLAGRARPTAVTWAGNQNTRWGSCTPADGTIRLSTRLRALPDWVVDYVLLHELAHLIEENHGPRFWRLLDGYPRTERARGYLEGYSAARG